MLNIFQADAIHFDIIMATNDILKKLVLLGRDLDVCSLHTRKMFCRDALQAGFTL